MTVWCLSRFIDFAPKEAQKIYVGKSSQKHQLTQDEINQLIVDLALEGKIVVRLKGGDPFVFGRGGEEAEAIVDNNLEFEVVPGVTSAVAVAAYAGIPVTHRDCASSFVVVTGHQAVDPQKNIDWKKTCRFCGHNCNFDGCWLVGIHYQIFD